MPSLPDVPEDDYRAYQTDQFGRANQTRIDQFTFGANNASRIQGLGMPGFEVPEIASASVLQQLPTPQLPPIPRPQLPAPPQLPLGQPPAPVSVPAPAPAPPQAPPIGLPSPAPQVTTTPQIPPPQVAPPAGPQPVPTIPGVPSVEGAPPSVPGVPGVESLNAPSSAWADQTGAAQTGGDLRAYARQAASRAGIDPDIFSAQIQQESGFNPQARSGAGALGIAQFMPGTAAGLNVDPTDPYAALDAAAQMDARSLKQYGGDWSKTLAAYNAGPGAVAQYDGVPPYKETQTYVSTILGNAGKPAQAQAPSTDQGLTGQPTSTAMQQSQFGDPQLTTDEAYSACGPAAAVRFAQAYGRNPTLREATDLAKSVGWTPGSGMAGISSEQQLLDKMGIPTRLVGADPSAIAQEAQTGNPVTISTPGHYFYADGYNPQTGQFHVGRSGLDLKQGAEWMTLQQMTNLMGPVQGALFANNPTIDNPSQSQTPGDRLDAIKQAATSVFSGFRTPQVPAPLASDDPQVQQLDRAVEIAHLPATQQRPTFSEITDQSGQVARAGIGDLGNIIGNAITSALSAAGLGGGPPGGNARRTVPEQNQDQFTADTGDVGNLSLQPAPDVGTRARQMIEQLQTLPGGRKLSDVVGAPDLLPPDLKDMPITEAIQEAVQRAGDTALKLSRPSLGPGGLGIYDPRLGDRYANDPRMDIPDVLEPVGLLLHKIFGEGAASEDAIRALDSVFGSEAQGGLRGAVSDEALRGLRTSGDVLESNVGNGMVGQIARNGADGLAGSLSRNFPQRVWDTAVRQLFDSGTDLGTIERVLSERLGRPLTDDERVSLLARKDPTHQAETLVETSLGSALRDLPDEAQQDFHGRGGYVEMETNRSVAEGLARQAEQKYLEGGIADRPQQRLDEALANLDDAQQAHAEALQTQRNVEAGTQRTGESISLDAANRRVADAREGLDAAVEAAREAQAASASQAVVDRPSSTLVRPPEQRDLILAEDAVRRLNQRYERLFARGENVPIAPTGESNAARRAYERQLSSLARQVGYAEDHLSQLRQGMGETSAAREASMNERAAQAGEAARTQSYVSPTPELAAARVRLRYEQQNLDRLQSAQQRGRQGLVDDLARAFKRVDSAQRDVDQATADLPAAARAQGWAQRTGRDFAGPNGETIHYDDVMQRLADLQQKYADQPEVWQKFLNGKQAISDLRKSLLQEQVDHGIIPQQTMDDLLKTYDFWTPTNNLDYMTDERPGVGLPRGSRFNVGDAGMRSYTPEGSSGQHENHVAALIRDVYNHKARIANNDVNANLIRGFGNDSTVMRKIADTIKEYVDAGGADSNLLHPDYRPKAGEQKLIALLDGKRQEYV
ncbi:MAG TPA: transglycosylase SLT domain-containing protein, partial [Chloroflexota bacterium]|nr:transglycosylase SLT domain-containing protein [Chloroflexota bacterium]